MTNGEMFLVILVTVMVVTATWLRSRR